MFHICYGNLHFIMLYHIKKVLFFSCVCKLLLYITLNCCNVGIIAIDYDPPRIMSSDIQTSILLLFSIVTHNHASGYYFYFLFFYAVLNKSSLWLRVKSVFIRIDNFVDAKVPRIELWTGRTVNQIFNFHCLIVFWIVLLDRLAMLLKTGYARRK